MNLKSYTMKRLKLISAFLIFSFLFISCIDEPAQPQSTSEIIKEISREWTCNMDEDGFNVDFNAVISSDPTDDTKVFISNFHKMGNDLSVYVIVHTDLSLDIPEQTKNNQTFKGSGIISDDYTEITWNYSIEYDNGDVSQVTGKYSYGVSA